MPDLTLKLGTFGFRNASLEMPEFIAGGGEQVLITHQLVGGDRIVDAMGRSDAPLEWAGRFMGPDAAQRSFTLDAMRIAGQQLLLTWGRYRYNVVIHSFIFNTERFYNVPYRIRCLVVQDLANPTLRNPADSIDSAIRNSAGSAGFFSDLLNDTGLTSLMDDVKGAVGAVNDFATATIGTINSVLGPVVAAQAYVQQAIGQLGVNVSNITSLGGIFPNQISESAINLIDQAQTFGDLGNLYNTGYSLGVTQVNLESLGGIGDSLDQAGSSLITAGGNLFGVASDVYGDPTLWTGIAERNGLTDPQLEGVNTLQIPDNPPNTGGVIGAPNLLTPAEGLSSDDAFLEFARQRANVGFNGGGF